MTFMLDVMEILAVIWCYNIVSYSYQDCLLHDSLMPDITSSYDFFRSSFKCLLCYVISPAVYEDFGTCTVCISLFPFLLFLCLTHSTGETFPALKSSCCYATDLPGTENNASSHRLHRVQPPSHHTHSSS